MKIINEQLHLVIDGESVNLSEFLESVLDKLKSIQEALEKLEENTEQELDSIRSGIDYDLTSRIYSLEEKVKKL